MIRISCPHCQRTYRTRTEGMGKTAVCTKCHQSFRIGDSRPSFEWKPSDLGEDSWIGVEPPEEKEEIKHCIICDAPLESGELRCLACGANQVTGAVHRTRSSGSAVKPSIYSVVPVRLILVAILIAFVGAGAYWMLSALSKKTVEMGDGLVDQALIARANKYLSQGGDPYTFSRKFSGQVDDNNLPRFIKLASSGDPHDRRIATLLIGCGQITQLQPIMDAAEAGNSEGWVMDVLQAVGARQLVVLSGHADESIRNPAARALCLLFGFKDDDEILSRLAEPLAPLKKTLLLNERCRPWPRAVGSFGVIINGVESPFPVRVEQVGRTFYLQVRSDEFRSLPERERTFAIPIEHWCSATGSAVDIRAVRGLISGTINLSSPAGIDWQGTIGLTIRQELTDALPGFLPIEPPPKGETIEIPILLEPFRP